VSSDARYAGDERHGRPAMNHLLEAALRYAKRGWKVLPVYEPAGSGCSCPAGDACGSPGKHPRCEHGVLDATTDERQIEDWWTRWPSANIAVATGMQSKIFAVDQDGGAASVRFYDLKNDLGGFPKTLMSSTGRPLGRHYIFQYPADGVGVPSSTGRIAKGIDVRGNDAYFVAPPSLHCSGNHYEWANDGVDPASAPGWLLRRARGAERLRSSRPAAPPTPIPEGQRNLTLTRMAGAMRRVGFSVESMEAALSTENTGRCEPPLPTSEVISIARSVGRYRPSDPVAPVASGGLELLFRTAREIAETTPEEVPWIARPWIVEGCLTEVDGKIKAAGKTTWVSFLCRAVLDGLPFMDEPTVKTPVVFLTEQSDVSFKETLRRADLLRRDDFLVLSLPYTHRASYARVIDATIKRAKTIGAKLIAVDTLARWARLPGDAENSAGDTAAAVEPLRQAAAEHDLAVVFVRHERKAGGAVGDAARGSSAIGGEVDVIVSIRRPEGGHRSTVRQIKALSRFDETPDELLIELTPNGYQVLGTSVAVEHDEAVQQLLDMLPTDERQAKTMEALVTETGKKRSTLQRAISKLEEGDAIASKRAPGAKSPILYWRPENTESESGSESQEVDRSEGDGDDPDE